MIFEMIVVNEWLSIPETELTFAASRSGGPGGQNVNKVNSRVSLSFDVEQSPSLTPEQRARILSCLSTRISKDGVLRVVAQMHRSQLENKQAAVERFIELMRRALVRPTPRHKTRISAAAHARRIDEKKRQSRLKKERSRTVERDDS